MVVPSGVRLADPLRRSFLVGLGRLVSLPPPLRDEWSRAGSDLIVTVVETDAHRRILVLAAGPVDGPRRWVIRQPLDTCDAGDAVERFVHMYEGGGRGRDDALDLARHGVVSFVAAVRDSLGAIATERPERSSGLRALAAAVHLDEEPRPAADDEHGLAGHSVDRPGTGHDSQGTRDLADLRAARAPASTQPRRTHRTRRTRRSSAAVAVVVAAALVLAGVVTRRPAGESGASTSAHSQAGRAADSPAFAVSARNADGGPVRLDPCHVYEYVVQPGGLGAAAAVAETGAALASLEEATGIAFRFAGTTTERFPFPIDPEVEPRSPILVSFESPADSRALLEGADVAHVTPGRPLGGLALSGPVAVTADVRVLAGGSVVVNDELRVEQRGRVLLHELGHVAGLDHVSDPDQLMATPVPETGPVAYRPGDRDGLAAVGAGHGCVVPEDRRAEILR